MSIPLPEMYFTWLKDIENVYCIEHSDRDWFISNHEELLEHVEIGKSTVPSWQQLRLLTKEYSDFTGASQTVDESGRSISLDRLSSCIVIGESNGDPLYCDPSDNNSIWCFHHDGGDVEKLSGSLESFIAELKTIGD